nr:immunoglobulin heavy chain junction region [Mus musculus]MBK4185062.1 immunoglobulin heavy chain junction region [Mus musculus]MBK4185063.1 immunoglobulin heavy chain junction region [Mus musculus]
CVRDGGTTVERGDYYAMDYW